MRLGRLVAAILLALGLGVFAWTRIRLDPAKSDQRSVRVAYATQVSNLPFFYALEAGEFEHRGLRIDLLQPMLQAPDIINAVISGQADVALDTALLSVIQANQRDSGALKVALWTIATRDNAFMRIIVPISSAARSLDDLRGKRLGHFPSPQLRAIGLALSKRVGGTADAIALIPVPPATILEALAASEIDAALVLEPTGSIAIQRGAARSLSDSPVVDLARDEIPIGAFSLSRAFITKRPEDAHLYVEALEAGCRLLRKDPERAPQLVAKYTVAKDPEVAAHVSYPRQWLRSEEDETKFSYLIELLRESGLELPRVTTAELAYTEGN